MEPVKFEVQLQVQHRFTVPQDLRDGLKPGRTYEIHIVDEVEEEEEEEEASGALSTIIDRESPG